MSDNKFQSNCLIACFIRRSNLARRFAATVCIYLALGNSCFASMWLTAGHAAGPGGALEEIAWGQPSSGLRAGLVFFPSRSKAPIAGRLAPTAHRAEFIEFEIVIENTGETDIRVPGSILNTWRWQISLTPGSGGTPLRAVLHPPPKPISAPGHVELRPGERRRLTIKCTHWIAEGREDTYDNIMSFTPVGVYWAVGRYQTTDKEAGNAPWRGTVTTGEVGTWIVPE